MPLLEAVKAERAAVAAVRPSNSIMPRVVFTPSGLDGEFDAGTNVLNAARQLGVDIDSVCGGRGICGRCMVTPGVGSFAKWQIEARSEALGDWTQTEIEYPGKRTIDAGMRLGCAATIHGDVVIDVPEASQVHRQVVRKSVNVDGLVVDPNYALLYVDVTAAELGDDRSAAELIADAVMAQHGRPITSVPTRLLASLHPTLNAERGPMTVALDGRGELAALWPGFVGSAYGIAIDCGSTTIAGHICDLSSGEILGSAGRMNPQIRFGEDLMSRVSYVMMNPGGERNLTAAVRQALDELVAELVAEADIDAAHLLDIVLVGNPIMHHLMLGIDPTPLGMAPFILATSAPVHTRATAIEIDAPNANVYFAPCIAGHVGADTAAVILSEGPHHSDHMQLVVDVGTNAEIVLGDRTVQFAASSPTGPAFEGAQISCGQRATAGAIERVRIDRVTLEPRVKVIGADMWSDEPGFTEATAELNISGICGSGIIEVIAEMFLSGIVEHDGTIAASGAARSARVIGEGRTFSYVLFGEGPSALIVTQNDVRAIQLAKAALRAGIDLLVAHAGVEALTDIRLAGAFGAHIDPLYAMVLGLVPDCELAGVRSVGNAAGAGAVRALLSAAQRADMEQAVRRVIKIETATEPAFQELFVKAMAFPHLDAPTTHMSQHVEIPARSTSNDNAGGRRRRRS